MKSRTMTSVVAAAVFVFALASWLDTAQAVIIAPGDGSGNTTQASLPDDPGWEYVARTDNGSTAVYLGNRFAITASHIDNINGRTLQFPAGSFAVVPGTATRVSNPAGSGLTATTDLVVFEIDGDPGLSPLNLASAPPPVGADVIMIGNGRNREPARTGWNLTMSDGDWVWTETGDANPDKTGFKWTSSRTLRWGTNVIEDDLVALASETDLDHVRIVDAGHGDVISLVTRFDVTGTSFEAQATTGDSGGAVFFKNAGAWELAGVIHAIDVHHDQPPATSVLSDGTFMPDGTNNRDLTFLADVSAYRNEIQTIIGVPEPNSIVLAGIGGLLAMLYAWRRRRRLRL